MTPCDDCSICLDQLPSERGTLQCGHTFCFGCIVSWSERQNTCPLCQGRFDSIVQASTARG
ncbi:hypothetical protein JKP88DRAFT_176057, partial [Tribonema minus]